MANMKVKPWQWNKTPIGRAAKSKDESTRIGQFEALESRQLLSAFHPVDTRFQWVGRGRSGTTEVRFDEAGNFLTVSGPEAGLHPNGLLGGGTKDPGRILVNFAGALPPGTYVIAVKMTATANQRRSTVAVSQSFVVGG